MIVKSIKLSEVFFIFFSILIIESYSQEKPSWLVTDISTEVAQIIKIQVNGSTKVQIPFLEGRTYYPIVYIGSDSYSYYNRYFEYDYYFKKRNLCSINAVKDSIVSWLAIDSLFVKISLKPLTNSFRFEFDIKLPHLSKNEIDELSFLIENLMLNDMWCKHILFYPNQNYFPTIVPFPIRNTDLLPYLPIEVLTNNQEMKWSSSIAYSLDLSIISQLAKTVVVDFDLEIPYLLDSKKYYHSISESYTFKNTLE